MYHTRYVAVDILEQFDDLLAKNDITIPSPEDDMKDPDNDARIYGSVYGDLLDSVEQTIVQMLIDHGVPRRAILDGVFYFKNGHPKFKEDKHNASH